MGIRCSSIEYQPSRYYIQHMIRRILIAVLVAWIGIAPAIANSCAAGCPMSSASTNSVRDEQLQSDVSAARDCHGQKDHQQDTKMPDGTSMVVACFVAASTAISGFSVPVLTIDIVSVQHASVLLPPLSFETSAPTKPPQA